MIRTVKSLAQEKSTMSAHKNFPRRSAEEAAALIPHGATLGIGGFTPPGPPVLRNYWITIL
jgi:hypothetical protein